MLFYLVRGMFSAADNKNAHSNILNLKNVTFKSAAFYSRPLTETTATTPSRDGEARKTNPADV